MPSNTAIFFEICLRPGDTASPVWHGATSVGFPTRGFLPVSYTHLDVYKRQLLRKRNDHVPIAWRLNRNIQTL